MKQAAYYNLVDENTKLIQCLICPHTCMIKPGKTGFCNIRKNVDGILYNLTYDRMTSVALDPIEKKPLYHFYPKTNILSFGTIGCNFKCLHCQNWEISQVDFSENLTHVITSKQAVDMAKKYNSIGIAYTYNEPLVNFEWILDTSKLAKEKGLKNVLVTNGYINEEPLDGLIPYIDAANVDVKAFTEKFYKDICKAKLEPVLRFVKKLFDNKIHVEVTNLIIPAHNDSLDEIEKLVDWVYSISADIPLHFSRYFPHYKMDINSTPFETLKSAYEIGIKKMNYVYIGNIWEEKYNNTYCPKCKEVLIKRRGYDVDLRIDGKRCKKCGYEISIVI